MHQPLIPYARFALAALLLGLAACGGVQVKPEITLPRALLQPLPARVGLVIDPALSSFRHEETRYGSNWVVDMGAGQAKMMDAMFGASFRDVARFDSIEQAEAATGLQAIFEPGIEQYSFATDRDTSGNYWAATIRYRIAVFTPDGKPVDTLTLTGYGSSRGGGGNDGALTRATVAAMRDAAAKFLVQLPRQSLATALKAGEVIKVSEGVALAVDAIEVVPIEP